MDCEVGRPRVNYREAITRRAEFDYLHKKQSGALADAAAECAWRYVVCRAGPVPVQADRASMVVSWATSSRYQVGRAGCR